MSESNGNNNDNHVTYNEEPNLIRTSSLDSDYIRRNLSLVNTPVKLLFDKDPRDMMENWTPEEVRDQRRLVKFDFARLSPSDYFVKFKPIKKEEYSNRSTVVSCIFWEEKELYIVTSVDIIFLLENLIQQSFTIEEKNRVRRNLQSLKPYTISRSNKNYQRFFQLLMSMEDPRPRNIEKDIKVFKWTDLFTALTKVISKYSSNNKVSVKVENASYGSDDGSNGKFNAALNDLAGLSGTNGNTSTFGSIRSMNAMDPMSNAGRNLNEFDLKNNTANGAGSSLSTSITSGGSISPEDELALNSLNYKPKKKRTNNAEIQAKTAPEASSFHDRHRVFKDGIRPSNPVPMKSESTQTTGSAISDKIAYSRRQSQSQSQSQIHSIDSQQSQDADANIDNMEVDSSDSTSTTGGSSSTYAVSSSDEVEGRTGSSQLKNSNSADGGSSVEDDIQSSNGNITGYPISGPIPVAAPVKGNVPTRGMIPSSSGGRSTDSNSQSGSDSNSGSGGSGGSGLFSNRHTGSDQNTGLTSVGDSMGNPPPKKSDSKTFNNINNFAQDQSNRIFGSVSQTGGPKDYHQPQYYQYPEASQIHYSSKPSVPSFNVTTTGTGLLNRPLSSTDSSATKDVKLPSLEEYFHTSNKNNHQNNSSGIKLAPLKNAHGSGQATVSDPKGLVEYSKEKSGKN